MGKLDGKIALVTGASKGIGVSIAKHLAAAGATVVITYATSKAGADKTLGEIAKSGGTGVALQADFSKEAEIKQTLAQVKKQFGKLDILVNNAGIYSFGPIDQLDVVEFHRQFDLNVLGLLVGIREALPLFSTEGGSIINVGSSVGTFPPPFSAVYSATKAAVDSISISLSKELGSRKIRVNSLDPGLVETEGTQTAGVLGSDFHDMLLRTTPLGRIGQPDDIGPVAVFLASSDAQWVTGQIVNVAGGQTM
jgi:3-oxoacyl-[acyl-carrier protein] reductase